MSGADTQSPKDLRRKRPMVDAENSHQDDRRKIVEPDGGA